MPSRRFLFLFPLSFLNWAQKSSFSFSANAHNFECSWGILFWWRSSLETRERALRNLLKGASIDCRISVTSPPYYLIHFLQRNIRHWPAGLYLSPWRLSDATDCVFFFFLFSRFFLFIYFLKTATNNDNKGGVGNEGGGEIIKVSDALARLLHAKEKGKAGHEPDRACLIRLLCYPGDVVGGRSISWLSSYQYRHHFCVCDGGGGHSVSIYRFVLPFSELVMTGSRGLLFKIGDEHNLTNVGFLVTLWFNWIYRVRKSSSEFTALAWAWGKHLERLGGSNSGRNIFYSSVHPTI